MALDTNTLAVIRTLNEYVGQSISYPFLMDEYIWRGGDRRELGNTLAQVLRQFPDFVEHENRLGERRRIQSWVRIEKKIKINV